ncbi:hypothetical protein BLA29_011596 [Euroglyphus maynei]|uniref:Uncharacterized protein n=1 Tax=Euroglyphus maynei TaxID=6958 RepID=A0A1Y3BM78_EURMA|nr:hypothetical protein BLA29_011596 [Euroglyphus maynei]
MLNTIKIYIQSKPNQTYRRYWKHFFNRKNLFVVKYLSVYDYYENILNHRRFFVTMKLLVHHY